MSVIEMTLLDAVTIATGAAQTPTIIAQPGVNALGYGNLAGHLVDIGISLAATSTAPTVNVAVEVSPDADTWLPIMIYDFALATLATAIEYTDSYAGVICRYDGGWQYVRMVATNNGDDVVTLSAWAVVQ